MAEILRWNWELQVGLSSELTPMEYRFQGGLSYTRGLNLDGRVLAPSKHDTKSIRIWLMPVGPDIKFGTEDMDEVGRLYMRPLRPNAPDLTARLFLPDEFIGAISTGFAAKPSQVQIWTFDEDFEEASVSRYRFSSPSKTKQ